MRIFLGVMQLFLATSCALSAKAFDLRDSQGQHIDLSSAISSIEPGSVLILGESHNYGPHMKSEVDFLKALRDSGHRVDVGMEFLEYPTQALVEKYRTGDLSEAEFLKQARWGGFPFSSYREQVQFPQVRLGENTWALNCPREITSKVGKSGLESLTTEEIKMLPPNFVVGNDLYRERFLQVIPHLPDGAADRYFSAQSIWDDTMAWKAGESSQIGTTLVIVVGEFHVQYGGGLPDRLRSRYPNLKIKTVSMLNTNDYENSEDLERQVHPHVKYGPRADFILIQ